MYGSHQQDAKAMPMLHTLCQNLIFIRLDHPVLKGKSVFIEQ
ncbi:hypothetical protein L293_3471 [Acinetobacter gyllenbergii CIP 110306 = MTCC 11365]|nr:hypothetical protein L293_3471 [Acinetobacter gyllenbergii CIP 110306 = MTCC 11365]